MNLSKKYTYPFLETIKIKEGKIYNLALHNQRLNNTRKTIFKSDNTIDLEKYIEVPTHLKNTLVKCRVLYQQEILSVEYYEYIIPTISSLKILICNEIDYQYKSSDRQILNTLYAKREQYDDIIIVKNNLVTDSFFANIILFNGQEWITPDTPLLNGTQREYLINKKLILPRRVTKDDIFNYQKIGLINAMLNMDDMPIILPENISFKKL